MRASEWETSLSQAPASVSVRKDTLLSRQRRSPAPSWPPARSHLGGRHGDHLQSPVPLAAHRGRGRAPGSWGKRHPLTFWELLGQDQRGMQQSEEQPGPLPHEARHVYRSDMRLSVHKGEKGPLRVAPSVAPALQHRAVLAASRGEPAAVALNRKKSGFAHLPAPF